MLDYTAIKDYIIAHRLYDSRLHGVAHWQQVELNGLLLAEETGADVEVVRLFALFHDSKRMDDGIDLEHGPRAAAFLKACHEAKLINITKEQLEKLHHACKYHTSESRSGDATIDTCYDADRLDLGRVGIAPNPDKMATKAGTMIARKALDEGVAVGDMREWIASQVYKG